MNLADITPLILTYNEAPNISRTLAKLFWAKRVVVVDSGSSDATLELLSKDERVEVCQRNFDTHAQQWNAGLELISSEWVLALDADYVVTDEWASEVESLPMRDRTVGYSSEFVYCIHGRPLRGSLYPPRIVLFSRRFGKYVQDGHTQRLVVQGDVKELTTRILHDDRKELARWTSNQVAYSRQEAKKLLASRGNALRWQDRLRKCIAVTPWLVPLVYLFARGGLLDGRAGLYYALQRGIAEGLVSLQLIEHHLNADSRD